MEPPICTIVNEDDSIRDTAFTFLQEQLKKHNLFFDYIEAHGGYAYILSMTKLSEEEMYKIADDQWAEMNET